MTIIEVGKMWSRDSADIEHINGANFRVAIREAYHVVHTVDATPIDIQAAPGLPAANSVYPGTNFVYAKVAGISRVSPIMSIVEIAYAGENDANDPEIRYTDSATEEPIDEDWNGNPICTVLGETIEGVTAEFADPVLIVKRKFFTFNQYLTAAYRRSTNSDTFDGWPPGTARMTAFDAVRVGGINSISGHWDVTAEITFRFPYRTTPAKAWYARVRHEGYKVKNPLGGKPVRAFDGNKSPSTRPVLLKNNGEEETDPANTIWLEFQRYGSLPYNALGLL